MSSWGCSPLYLQVVDDSTPSQLACNTDIDLGSLHLSEHSPVRLSPPNLCGLIGRLILVLTAAGADRLLTST